MIFYVVVWDFALEESAEVVRDGVVFSDITAAREEALKALIASINSDFAARAKASLSRRLGKSGYVCGEPLIRAVDATDRATAITDALAGMGEEIPVFKSKGQFRRHVSS